MQYIVSDLESPFPKPAAADDVTLSMLDHAVSYGTMPVAGYRLIHWGTGFNGREKSVIAGWIRNKRGYDEPVCPIPESVEFDKAKAELGERLFNDGRISTTARS